jgi:DNA-binding transcriptional LysR family regulator
VFDWNDARYFLAVARLGSLSKAGRSLGVQQSTVGRRIGALEAALDARLFERTSEGWQPTAAGLAFAERAERIEDEATAAERQLAGEEGRAAGTLRMTAPQALGFYFLVPILARLRAEQPDIVVELIAENASLNLSRREADLALRFGKPKQQRLVMRRLGEVVNALYASRDYLARAGPVRGGALGGHTFVDFDAGFVLRETPVWLSQRMRGARCALRVNGTPGIFEAVRAGMGVGVLPSWLADEHADLQRVLPEHALRQELWLVVHHDLRRAARVRVVTQFLVRALAPLTGRRSPRGRHPSP